MKVGDIIRLKQPFYPPSNGSLLSPRPYQYGLVAALIHPNLDPGTALQAVEIVVNLYDPNTAEIYTDAAGVKALYIFYPDEIDFT
ncbi:MAG TPA: hypothetical protein V6D06_16100 [Trichocoleus sp.]